MAVFVGVIAWRGVAWQVAADTMAGDSSAPAIMAALEICMVFPVIDGY